jgi:hypothetical protein
MVQTIVEKVFSVIGRIIFVVGGTVAIVSVIFLMPLFFFYAHGASHEFRVTFGHSAPSLSQKSEHERSTLQPLVRKKLECLAGIAASDHEKIDVCDTQECRKDAIRRFDDAQQQLHTAVQTAQFFGFDTFFVSTRPSTCQ